MKNRGSSELIRIVRELLPEAISIRREIHRHPEIAFQEVKTAALIRRHLVDCGVELLESGLPTAVIGRIQGVYDGPTLLVRQDIDALPMDEMTDLPFTSEAQGVCHSCGHDIHTAALLLLAKTMVQCRRELHGDILLAFQPAEEIAAGGKAMLAAGFGQKETHYDQVIGFHTAPALQTGDIGIVEGVSNASMDIFNITVSGEGGHGAHPYRCADPVAAAAYLITQLQTIITRENPALEPAVLTIGSIHGGTVENIIPTDVVMGGTLRTLSEESRHKIWQAIHRMTNHCCEAMRAIGKVNISEGIPVLYNEPELCQALVHSAEKVLGPGHVHPCPTSMGSDDFSCFLAAAPGFQFLVGTGNDLPESRLGIHNPRNIFDEESIYVGAVVMAQYLLDKLGG